MTDTSRALGIVILDGADCVGKTTLKRSFSELTDHRHWVIDRGPGSFWVYDHLLRGRSCLQAVETLRVMGRVLDVVYVHVTTNPAYYWIADDQFKKFVAELQFEETEFPVDAITFVDDHRVSPEANAKRLYDVLVSKSPRFNKMQEGYVLCESS